MPKSLGVFDAKPSNQIVSDVKPFNQAVLDVKPRNKEIPSDSRLQLFEVVLGRGQPIGLLLSLTYKEDITVISAKTI